MSDFITCQFLGDTEFLFLAQQWLCMDHPMFYSFEGHTFYMHLPLQLFFVFFRSFSSVSRFWSTAHLPSLSASLFTDFFAVGVTWMSVEPYIVISFLFLCLAILESLSKTLKSLSGIKLLVGSPVFFSSESSEIFVALSSVRSPPGKYSLPHCSLITAAAYKHNFWIINFLNSIDGSGTSQCRRFTIKASKVFVFP